MMESCYKLSRPFSTSDFMHGPISIIEEGTPVLMLAPDSEFTAEFISMATRLALLGANIISFTDITEIKRMSNKCLEMPVSRGMNVPFIYSLAVELYVAFMAEALGVDPDSPRNRTKITITK